MDGMPTDAEWEHLTVVDEKRRIYGQDLYFRESWADLKDILGPDAAYKLRGVAMLSVKPDAVVGRRLGPVLRYMIEHGFVPVATTTFGFTRHSMREVWRYDWHIYTVDRLEFCTFWYITGDVVLFLLKDGTPDPGVPGTVRLSELKGVGDPAKRTPDQMRSVLRPPNRILNFVHVGDEPADVVRELAIFLDRPERRAFYERLADSLDQDRTAEAEAVIERMESEHPEHDLDIEAALLRLSAAPAVSAETIEALRQIIAEGRKIHWDELCSLVDPGGEGIDRWDFIVLATTVLYNEREVPAALLPSVEVAKWAATA